jgi:hypothetical protein
MRLLKISATSMLAVAAAVAIAAPAYATKSLPDVTSQTGNTYVTPAAGTTESYPTDEVSTLKKDVDRENAMFIAEQKSVVTKGDSTAISEAGALSSLAIEDRDNLDAVSKNLDNLTGNVVMTTIEEKKSKDAIE